MKKFFETLEKISENPLLYKNDISLIKMHSNLRDNIEFVSTYLVNCIKDISSVCNNKDMMEELKNNYIKMKRFFIQYYNLLYKNSIFELESYVYKKHINALDILIRGEIKDLGMFDQEDGLNYYNYEDDIEEDGESVTKIDISLNYECAKICCDLKINQKKKKIEEENNDDDKYESEEEEEEEEIIFEEKSDDDDDNNEINEVSESANFLKFADHDSDDEMVEMFGNIEISNENNYEMDGFFNQHKNDIDLLEMRISDKLELFLPTNEEKIAIHYFYELLKLHYIVHQDYLKLIDKTINEIFPTIFKFGLDLIFYDLEKKIKVYSPNDLYQTFINFIDRISLIYKIFSVMDRSEIISKTDTKNKIINEIVLFLNLLYIRLYEIVMLDDNIFDFPKKSNFTFVFEKKEYVNTRFVFYFVHMYKSLFSIFEFDDLFLQFSFIKNKEKKNIKFIKYDFQNKQLFSVDKMKDKLDNYMSAFKGKKRISNRFRLFIFKFCAFPANRDWYLYYNYTKNISDQQFIIKTIRNASKLQEGSIEEFEKSYDIWLKNIRRHIVIDVTSLLKTNKKDEVFYKDVSDAMELLLNEELNENQTKNIPSYLHEKNKLMIGMKSEFKNMLTIFSLHMWFSTHKGYKYWIMRYFIPFEAFTRYWYIFYEMLYGDSDNLYNEPFILQIGQFEVGVLYKKNIYKFGYNMIGAMYTWAALMNTYHKDTINPIKSHNEHKTTEKYYIWVYVWKKLYFQKSFDLHDFFNSLSKDKVKIGVLFDVPMNEEEEGEENGEEEEDNNDNEEDKKRKRNENLVKTYNKKFKI